MPPDSITCPTCGWTSYNPNDIKEKYCGNCKQFHMFMSRPGEARMTDPVVPSLAANQLAGCVVKVDISRFTIKEVVRIVMQLMFCSEHQGSHHFAVIDEGNSVIVSEVGLSCIQEFL